MAYTIIRVTNFDGELIGTCTRGPASPNTYETRALAQALADRTMLAEERYSDDSLYVAVAGDPAMRAVPRPARPGDNDEIPW